MSLRFFALLLLLAALARATSQDRHGWLLITDAGFSINESTENNSHLRRDFTHPSLAAEDHGMWRTSFGQTHVFVAPTFKDISPIAARTTPLVMRALEDRLWIATPKFNKDQKKHCLAERNKLNLLNVEVIGKNGAIEIWEGDRAHEADGGECYDVIVVFTSIMPPQPSKLNAKHAETHIEQYLTSNQAGDARIHDLVKRVNETRLKETVETLSSFYSRQSNSDGAKEAQNWIFQQYSDLGLSVSTYGFISDYSSNVIAELPSITEPTKVIIVSGHYDSRSVNSSDPSLRAPGADDNGTGTASALELARVIIESGLEFVYTIRFCAWSGEEQGLRGSAAYAAEMKAKGVEIVAVFNGDMLGYNAPKTALTLGMKDLYITPWLLQTANTITSVYVPELTIASSASCCSDHQSFFQNGFPSIGYFESKAGASDYPNYHKVTDTPDKVHFGLLHRICSSMLAAVATFAVPLPM